MGVVTGPFEPDAGAVETIDYMFGKRLARLENHVGIQFDDLPIDANARGIHGAARSARHFRADAIARDQGNFMRHNSLYSDRPR